MDAFRLVRSCKRTTLLPIYRDYIHKRRDLQAKIRNTGSNSKKRSCRSSLYEKLCKKSWYHHHPPPLALHPYEKYFFGRATILASRISFVHIRDMIRINMCVFVVWGIMLGREWRKLGYGYFNCWNLEIWIILIFFFFKPIR